MSYRLNTEAKPLFWCECIIESHGTTRMEYQIKVCFC